MKRLKRWISLCLVAIMFSSLSISHVMAGDMESDSSEWRLISEIQKTEEDGIPYVERIYAECIYDNISRTLKETGRYYKDNDYGARGKLRVYAEFKYDTSAKTAYAYNVSGEIVKKAGIIGNPTGNPYVINQGSPKVTAKYECEVVPTLGSKTTWRVSMHCDYKGNIT